MLPPDKELARRLKIGDKEAFRIIFDRYSDRILTYLCWYLGDYHKAEDVTMQAFIKLSKDIRGYKEMGCFSAWLYRIAVNCAKRELENRARRKEVSIEAPVHVSADHGREPAHLSEFLADETNRPDHNAELNELQDIIQDALSQLDIKYREALVLCDIEGFTYNEAARILNITTFNLASRVLRARQKVRKILKQLKKELRGDA